MDTIGDAGRQEQQFELLVPTTTFYKATRLAVIIARISAFPGEIK
jgi:hypothetical protein